jgi:DNA transposition AAA+ family ATPase
MALRDDLKKLMDERKLSQSYMARALGVSAATVSLYVDGKYTGDTAKIDRAARGFIERFKDAEDEDLFNVPVIKTFVYRRLFNAAKICHVRRKYGLAYGDAGIGKTVACRRYVDEFPSTIFIEADPYYTEKDIIRDIYQRLGLSVDNHISMHNVFLAVVDKLRDSRRLIIVDESENLPFRALEGLRRIHDMAGIGVLMVGMPRLKANIISFQKYSAQIKSRCTVVENLQKLELSDVESIVKSMLPGSGDLYKAFNTHCNGSTRYLVNLLESSIALAKVNDSAVTKEIINHAADTLIL